MKIVIDPGHGGIDPGAIGHGLLEKDINLLVGNYLSELLRNAGYDVVSTRTTDEYLSLLRRSQIAAEENADLFISIHVNSGGGTGTETFYSILDPDPTLATLISENISLLGLTNRGAKTRVTSSGSDYYSVIRETVRLSNAWPYLVELFFIDSANDTTLYKEIGYQPFAQAIFNAIVGENGQQPEQPEPPYQIHIVQQGDTLFSIARLFNTTVAAIKLLNNLTSDALSIGQQLLIPEPFIPEPSFTYIVQAGDTLFSIASRFNTTVAAIKALNHLTSDRLSIGQRLLIPMPPESGNTFIHIVQSGDTLFSIARQFNTTIATIKALNNLVSDIIHVGQQLLISSDQLVQTIHIVQPGDTLFSIARRFGTTVEAIKSLNNLTTSTLSIGQQLLIPS